MSAEITARRTRDSLELPMFSQRLFHAVENKSPVQAGIVPIERRNRATQIRLSRIFRIFQEETASLKSQSVTSSWGGRRKVPVAFTELGVAMLSSVLHSERAVQMNIVIMRAFVKLRLAAAASAAGGII